MNTQKIILDSLSKQGLPENVNLARLPVKELKVIGKRLVGEAGKVIENRKLSKLDKQKALISIKYGFHQSVVNFEIRKLMASMRISPDLDPARLEVKEKIIITDKLWEFFAHRISDAKKVYMNDKIRMFYSLGNELMTMRRCFKEGKRIPLQSAGKAERTSYVDPNAFEFDFSELSIDDIDPFYKFREALFEQFEHIQEMTELLAQIHIPYEYKRMRITNAKKGDILLTQGGCDIGAAISAMMGSRYTSAMMFLDDGYTVKKVHMDFDAVGIEEWDNSGFWGSWDDTFRKLTASELANGVPGTEQSRVEDFFCPNIACSSEETQHRIYENMGAILIKPDTEEGRDAAMAIADKYMNLSGYYRLNALMHMHQMDDTNAFKEGRGATDGSGIWHACNYGVGDRLNVETVDPLTAMDYAKLIYDNFYNAMLGEDYTAQWYQDYTHEDECFHYSVEKFCNPNIFSAFSPASGLWELMKNGMTMAAIEKGLTFTSVVGIAVFIIKSMVYLAFKDYGEKKQKEAAEKIANQICNTIFFDNPGNTSPSWRYAYVVEMIDREKTRDGKSIPPGTYTHFDPKKDMEEIKRYMDYDHIRFGCPPGDHILPDGLLPERNGSFVYKTTEKPEVEGGYYLKNRVRVQFK